MRHVAYNCVNAEGFTKILSFSSPHESNRYVMFETWKDYGPTDDRKLPPSRQYTYYSAVLGPEANILVDLKVLEASDENIKLIDWLHKKSGLFLVPGRAHIRR